MTRVSRFRLPVQVGADEIAARLAREGLEVRRSAPKRWRRRFLDTFDWRLWRAGGILTHDGATLRWHEQDGTLRRQVPSSQPPEFSGDLPESLLREELVPLLFVRRLLTQAEAEVDETTFTLQNARGKTVARVVLQVAPDGEPAVPDVVEIVGVRGYEAAAERAARRLEAAGAEPLRDSALEWALAGTDRRPGGYSSKLNLRLAPEEPAAAAMSRIYLRLLEVVEANEEGVCRDLDSEFLHDLRVALRRTRSALSQVKKVFPTEPLRPLKRELKWVFSRTGPTRDLDVYQLKIPGYRAALPGEVAAALDPLAEFLTRRQRSAQRRLAADLRGPRYLDWKRGWRAFLEAVADDGSGAVRARAPISWVAARRIRRSWDRVLALGGAVDDTSPAESLHRVRIEGKKLRYLLELFASLLPPELRAHVKSLKRLQDCLGDFNDYEVQQQQLQEIAEEMAMEQNAAPATLLAMGRLVAYLSRAQRAAREEFAGRFRPLADPGTRRQVRALLRQVEEIA